MAARQKGAASQKGNMMEIKKCRGCGKTLGVVTENGFMVGNVILDYFKGTCGCGHYASWNLSNTPTIQEYRAEYKDVYEGRALDDFEE